MDRRIDLAVALAFMAFGLFMIVEATTIRQGMMRDPVGPRAAFYVCGAILGLGGATLAVRRLMQMRRSASNLVDNEGTADEPGYPAHAWRFAALAALCLAYAAAFRPAGYLIATPLFIMAALAVLGQRRWRANLFIAVTFTLIAYLVFAQALGVRVPVGPFTPFFRDMGWIIL